MAESMASDSTNQEAVLAKVYLDSTWKSQFYVENCASL
jgi:hypothetical protein